MSDAISRTAVTRLRQQAHRIIVEDGILNSVQVLNTVVELVERATGRPRVKTNPQHWTEICRFTEWAYGLGLLVGMHSDVQVIANGRRSPRRRARKKGGTR